MLALTRSEPAPHARVIHRLWLLFAQAVTVMLAAWLLVAALRPDLLPAPWPAARGEASSAATAIAPSARPPAGEAPPAVGAASYAEAAARAMPAVVNLYTTAAPARRERNPLLDDPIFRFFFGDAPPGGAPHGRSPARPSSLGSGVILDARGHIVTNAHVLEAAEKVEVALADGRRAAARIVGADPETDLAVIRIDLPELPAITLGSAETLRVGDVVLAIGNPFGVGQTVTMGIVSALGRNRLGATTFENYVQTDAAINPGNSGGALIDGQGRLVGINTLIFSRSGGSQGIGFAIPSATVRQVVDQLIENGRVVRGWLGVETQDLTAALAESFGLQGARGVLVAGVVKGSPAADGGLRAGDVVLSVAGRPISGSRELLDTVAALRPGQAVEVNLLRDRRETRLTVRVGTRPAPRRG
jgi:serine protease DegQ